MIPTHLQSTLVTLLVLHSSVVYIRDVLLAVNEVMHGYSVRWSALLCSPVASAGMSSKEMTSTENG